MSDDPVNAFSSVKRQFDNLLREAKLENVTREINDLSTRIRNLPSEIEGVRKRGYAFRSYLERKAEVIESNWDEIKRKVNRTLDREVEDLHVDVDEAEEAVKRGERLSDTPDRLAQAIDQIESTVERLETKVEAAIGRLRGMYSTLSSDVSETNRQLQQIKWFCDMKDEASFEFLAGESVFLVAEAEWLNGDDDPDGVLYLTDQRLLFEQKEKVGKRFGMFGGKEVQELDLDAPLHHIEEVEAENKGMFGGKDMLHFTMKDGPYAKITVEVKGSADNKYWVKQINRVLAGEVDDERAIEPDPEMVEKLKNAPTECHVCGATMPMLVAGQTQVECEYCGAVIRI